MIKTQFRAEEQSNGKWELAKRLCIFGIPTGVYRYYASFNNQHDLVDCINKMDVSNYEVNIVQQPIEKT